LHAVRLFFSVPVSDEARSAASGALRAMKRAAGDAPLSWTKDEQLHFTLAFLGEQPEDALSRLRAAGDACAKVPAFDLTLSGAGAFPNPRRPRVLWIRAEQGARELEELARCLADGLRYAEFALEKRPFRAHLTVARVKPGGERGAAHALGAVAAGELARMRVDRLLLMQSHLGPRGAKHVVVHETRLA
jgi:RNA 2',3'-cyclic 3'-phosphodiesterase